MELYKKYRPTALKDVLGQDSAIKILRSFKEKGLPHALLFSGPSGVGKTTIARILKIMLKCSDLDFQEANCADFRGIDMVRDIREKISLSPVNGRSRIWLIDEAGELTLSAQKAFLKILEDTPNHVYFFLATTDPQKIIKTVRNRCTEIKLGLVDDGSIHEILDQVIGCEGIHISEEVKNGVVDAAEGSPRKALVLLNQIMGIEDDEQRLEIVTKGDSDSKGIEIARGLIKTNISWVQMSRILKEVKEDPETVRWIVLGYAKSCMMGGKGNTAKRAYQVFNSFRDNFYDSKQAGLAGACWEVIHGS